MNSQLKNLFQKLKNPTFRGEVVQAILTFCFSILVTRVFGIKIYGQLIILYTISNFFTDVIGVRSNEVIVYYWNKDKELNNTYFTTSIITDVFLGISIMSIIYISAPTLSKFIGVEKVAVENIRAISFYTLFLYLRGSFWGILQAEKLFKSLALIKNIELVLRFLIVAVGILFFKTNLEYLIHMTIICSLITYIGSVYLSRKKVFYSFTVRGIITNIDHVKLFLSYTATNFLSTIIKAGNKQIDSLIVAKFLDQGMVAIYDLVKKFCSPIALITNTLVINSLPKFIQLKADNPAKIRSYINGLDKTIFYVSSISFIALILLMIPINGIYRIELTVPLFAGLLLINLVNQFSWWTRGFSLVFDQKLSVYVNLYSTLCSFTILIALTKFYGIYGLMGGLLFIRTTSLAIFKFYLIKLTNK